MILRVRGAVHGDLEWTANRVPSIAEMVKIDDNWYRVTNVLWAVKVAKEDGGKGAYDVAIVLASANEPVYPKPEGGN